MQTSNILTYLCMIRLEWKYNKVQRWFDVNCFGLGISCYHFKELFKKTKEKSDRFDRILRILLRLRVITLIGLII